MYRIIYMQIRYKSRLCLTAISKFNIQLQQKISSYFIYLSFLLIYLYIYGCISLEFKLQRLFTHTYLNFVFVISCFCCPYLAAFIYVYIVYNNHC